MKSLKISVIILMAATVASSLAIDAQSNIKAIYKSLDALTMKKDVDGLKKMIQSNTTKDFTYVGDDGKTLTGDAVFSNLAEQMKSIDKVKSSSTSLVSIVKKGDTITVKTKSATEMTAKTPGDEKLHVIKTTEGSVDIWKKVGAKWLLQSVKITSSGTWLDGKKVSGG